VRQVNFGFDFFCAARRAGGGLACSAEAVARAQIGAHLLGFVLFQRTGMRFLFGHPNMRERVENGLALDFQFPGKIVDSNLTHPAFRISAL
jgi:hypothetical protein